VAKIIRTLDEKLPKSYNVIEGTNDNKSVFMLNNLPLISICKEDLTLIVELIMDGFQMVSTFPRLN
jgi:hypothetical protein